MLKCSWNEILHTHGRQSNPNLSTIWANVKFNFLHARLQFQQTWITFPYWMTVPSSFLFSESFCFFSKSAACCRWEGKNITRLKALTAVQAVIQKIKKKAVRSSMIKCKPIQNVHFVSGALAEARAHFTMEKEKKIAIFHFMSVWSDRLL